jgi:hypothetical protein
LEWHKIVEDKIFQNFDLYVECVYNKEMNWLLCVAMHGLNNSEWNEKWVLKCKFKLKQPTARYFYKSVNNKY